MIADALSTALAVRPGTLSPELARHVRQVVMTGDPGAGAPPSG
jgi:hypothetical protein